MADIRRQRLRKDHVCDAALQIPDPLSPCGIQLAGAGSFALSAKGMGARGHGRSGHTYHPAGQREPERPDGEAEEEAKPRHHRNRQCALLAGVQNERLHEVTPAVPRQAVHLHSPRAQGRTERQPRTEPAL